MDNRKTKLYLQSLFGEIKKLDKEDYEICNFQKIKITDGLLGDGRIVEGYTIHVNFFNEKDEDKW